MPVVRYRGGGQLPGSTGTPRLSAAPIRQSIGAVEDVATSIRDIALVYDDKQRGKAVAEAKNRYQETLNARELDLSTSRTMGGVEANPATNTRSVYDESLDYTIETEDKVLSTVDPRYMDAAQAGLKTLSQSHTGWASKYQATEQNKHRGQVRSDGVESIGQAIDVRMRTSDSGTSEVLSQFDELEAVLVATSAGADVQGVLDANKTQLSEKAIQAKAQVNPTHARAMLESTALRDHLDSTQIKALTAQIDDKDVELSVDAFNGQYGTLPFTVQAQIADNLPKQGEMNKRKRKAAQDWVNSQEATRVKIENSQQSDKLEFYHSLIFVDQAEMTNLEVDSSIELTAKTKQTVKGWIAQRDKVVPASDESKRQQKILDNLQWDLARSKIFSRQWGADDLAEQMIDGQIPEERYRELVKLAEDFNNDPQIYTTVDEFFLAEYPSVYKNRIKRAQVMLGVMNDVSAFLVDRGDKARPPSGEQILTWITDNARGPAEDQWYDPPGVDLVQDQYPGLDQPLIELDPEERARYDLRTRDVARRIGEGFLEAVYEGSVDAITLGDDPQKPQNFLVDDREGNIKSIPKTEWLDILAEEAERE